MMTSLSREGVYKIAAIFEKIGFVFREQPIEDYGIDAIIEERGEKYLTGKMLGVQIKCGSSYFKEQKDGKIVYRGQNKHFNYWLNYSLPVVIVLYDPEQDICIYESISNDKITKTSKEWKIEINLKNRLEAAGEVLRRLNKEQSEYHKKFAALAFSRGLMELADRERLIIEVMEWINKGSGRGEFIIKEIQNDGQEQILYNKTIIGFGPRSYDKVLPALFPWAELRVDDIYYELNGGREFMESRRRENPNIYPYQNSAGEVDWYRFLPTVNRVGRAFMVLDEFLDEGEMYQVRF